VNYKELGATGLTIPEIGLGTWTYHSGPEPLRKGLEAGALFIDTAERYGSEETVGEAIRGIRPRVFLATKVSPEHFRRADVLRAADQSLKRMGTDYIDLYQLHEPNHEIAIEETMAAMEELVDAGKVRYIGVSNFSVEQMRAAQRALRKYPLVANQVRYNLVDRTIEEDLFPYCQAQRISIIAYSPLARGLSFIRDNDPEGILAEVARETGKSPAQVAINWCLCKDNVVAIPKGNSVEQVLDICGASGWRLSPEHLRRLNEGVQWRRRSQAEKILRRLMPPKVKRLVGSAVRLLPASVRRRFN
jgi:diketogulonate reductase-like aldo/keto reductase